MKQLTGSVAIVAGATRGAGRGIACMLGEAGLTVYCTGRSTRGQPSPVGRLETIEETAEMVTARGGTGLWEKVDHSQPEQVGALFERVRSEQHGRLDVLVNDLSGDWNMEPDMCGRRKNPLWKPFWQRPLGKGLRTQHDGVESHLITAYYAAQLMSANRRGLIVEMTDGNHLGYNDCGVYYSLSKVSAVVLANLMSVELREYNVAVVALTPGDMLSEVRFEREVEPGQDWATIRQKPGLAIAESCCYTGRAVVALASDPNIMDRTGHALSTGVLAREYGFADEDGTQPLAYTGEGQFESNGNFVVHRFPLES